VKNPPPGPWRNFIEKADTFMMKTEEHILQAVNPGGYYQAIWCRDASYILKDWTLAGNVTAALQQLYLIWSHQIDHPSREKLVYGRGSPEMKFLSEEANEKKQKEFSGALPTTIYPAGFSEIYGQSPDIDSTALMISTTAWIMKKALKRHSSSYSSNRQVDDQISATMASEHSADYVSSLLRKLGITDPAKAIDFLLPRMLKAVEYLLRRDTDSDGLLEQNHNEDWMDTILRAGKIVYTQASWILALKNLSALLLALDKENEAKRISDMADRTIKAAEERLWSEEDGAYIDIQESHHIGGPYRTLTQDVSLYLVAISETSVRDNLTNKKREQEVPSSSTIAENHVEENTHRANSTLDALKSRVWKEKWPLVTEVELKSTGPWLLKPYQYHNHTFWPWTTGIEMLARSRFDRVEECNVLLSTLTSESNLQMHTFYEWINPITDEGNGAFPFRTGISAVRISIVDIFNNIRKSLSAT
jgi:glycogen debranching enzyme